MFGKAARIKELEGMLDAAEQHIRILQNTARLVSVTQNGRELVVTFLKGAETFKLITYSTMESDVKGLRQWANIT